VGAVGCNLEDTDHAAGRVLRDPEQQAGFLAAVRRAAEAARANVVINARVDVFLRAPAGSRDGWDGQGTHQAQAVTHRPEDRREVTTSETARRLNLSAGRRPDVPS